MKKLISAIAATTLIFSLGICACAEKMSPKQSAANAFEEVTQEQSVTSVSEVISQEQTTTSVSEVISQEQTTTSVSEVISQEQSVTSIPEEVIQEQSITDVSEVTSQEQTVTDVSEVTSQEQSITSVSEVTSGEQSITDVSEVTSQEQTVTSVSEEITQETTAISNETSLSQITSQEEIISETTINISRDSVFALQNLDDGNVAASDYIGISIDGSYDDWSDKPHSQLQYPWDNVNHYHLGALFRDEQYVYLHIKMSPNSYTHFNGYNYCFNIDGMDVFVVVVPPDNVQATRGSNTPLIVRAQNGYGIIDGAYGILTTAEGSSDEWEVKIPLVFFSPQPDSISSIMFSCTNLGPQKLIAVGTPTAPFIIAGIGVIFASGGYYASRKKKRAV